MTWRKQSAKQIVNMLPDDPDQAMDVMSQVLDAIEAKPGPSLLWVRSKQAAKVGAVLVGIFLVSDALDLTNNAAKALRGDPLQYNRITLLTPTIHSNEPLKLHISTLRHRLCAWGWNMFWEQVNPDANVLVARTQEPGRSINKIDEPNEYTVSIIPPRDLMPGMYRLTTRADVLCSHDDRYTEQNDPVLFKVVD